MFVCFSTVYTGQFNCSLGIHALPCARLPNGADSSPASPSQQNSPYRPARGRHTFTLSLRLAQNTQALHQPMALRMSSLGCSRQAELRGCFLLSILLSAVSPLEPFGALPPHSCTKPRSLCCACCIYIYIYIYISYLCLLRLA